MIKFNYTIDCERGKISNHNDVKEFSESMLSIQHLNDNSQQIFVWSGFGSEIPAELFDNSTWPQNFVGLFGNQEIWPWKFKFTRDEPDHLGNQELFDALASPSRDVLASLRIRDFNSDDKFQGSLEWFDDITEYLNDEYSDGMVVIGHIIKSLRIAREAGITLFLEKISLIVNCDPNNSITLTPHLHRDGAYGHLESSIVSFYSERTTPHSSTLFFPDLNFETASHLKPITAEKICINFPSVSAYSLKSGSLAIFSGKLGNDGSKSDLRGALHMSPEGFFPTRRIVFLFRSKISNQGRFYDLF